MRVFVTGATGFIGSHLTRELIANGHQVLGMTRSDEGAAALRAAGAEPHRGTIEDLASLRAGAEQADGVVHLAFNHDFSRFMQNVEEDGAAIEAMAEVLAGSERPLLVTSGVAIAISEGGVPATEQGPARTPEQNPRVLSEHKVAALAAQGVHASVVRLPQVHDPRRQGLITFLVQIARDKGTVAYVGDGANRWAAAAVDDVARLYRLALEKGAPGAIYHAVGEEGVSARAIAEAIGPRLGLPVTSITAEEKQDYFGWLGLFADLDMPASSAWTQAELGWMPTGPGLINSLHRLEV